MTTSAKTSGRQDDARAGLARIVHTGMLDSQWTGTFGLSLALQPLLAETPVTETLPAQPAVERFDECVLDSQWLINL